MTRVFLATGLDSLRDLHAHGALPAGSYTTFVPADDDEETEYATLQEAAEHARREHGRHLVLAADLDAEQPGAGGVPVPIARIAAIHVDEDLSWYAVQELDQIL